MRPLATVDDAIEAGEIAREEAERRLRERGLNPDDYPLLLHGLAHATEQAVAAHEYGRADLRDYHECLDSIYEQLAANPVVDRAPRPPKRTIRMDW